MAIDLGLVLALTTTQLSQNHFCAEIPEQIENVREQAREAEFELEERFASEKIRQHLDRQQRQLEAQLNALLQNEESLAEVLRDKQTPPQLVTVLNAAQTNPNAIEEFLNEQREQLPERLRNEIYERRDEQLERLQQLSEHCQFCAEVPERMEGILEQAREAEAQLEEQLARDEFQQQIEQRQRQLEARLNALLQDKEKLVEILENEQIPPHLVAVLNAAQTDANAIEEFANQQREQLPGQLRNQIHERRDELLEELLQFSEHCR